VRGGRREISLNLLLLLILHASRLALRTTLKKFPLLFANMRFLTKVEFANIPIKLRKFF
jgi:hypothetical protein